jgi:hypothetical protein
MNDQQARTLTLKKWAQKAGFSSTEGTTRSSFFHNYLEHLNSINAVLNNRTEPL